FLDMELPSRREEEWSRTDIRLFRFDRFGLPPEEAGETPAPGLLTQGVSLAGEMATSNSRAVNSRLDRKWRDRGVLFGPLDELLLEHGDLLRPYYRQAVPAGIDKFSALEAACWTGGTLLYVPRGVAVDEPLHALSAMSAGGVDFSHVLVVLEEGAEATLLM